MLKERIITAIVLVALLLGGVFGLDNETFALCIAGVVLIAAWEWAGLMRWDSLPLKGVFVGLLIAGLYLQATQPIAYLGYAVIAWWVLALLLIVSYPASAALLRMSSVILVFVGLLVLVSTWQAIVSLQGKGYLGIAAPWSLLYPILIVAASDTGAYFAGRAFGKHKLAVKVSPGKTWEGFAGGLLLASFIAVAVTWYLDLGRDTGLKFIALSIVVSMVSVIGDLFESIIKRERGVKDSGRILPGHGGILDRVDSIVAALPVFVAGMEILNLNSFLLRVFSW